MEMMKAEGEERCYATSLLASVTTDTEAANIAVKEGLPERTITRLREILQRPPKRPKFVHDVNGLSKEELEYLEFRSIIATTTASGRLPGFLGAMHSARFTRFCQYITTNSR
jgi:hypothetical protein